MRALGRPRAAHRRGMTRRRARELDARARRRQRPVRFRGSKSRRRRCRERKPSVPHRRPPSTTTGVTTADLGRPPVVAVLGGGQLGRMLGLAGIPLGVRSASSTPSPTRPPARSGPLVGARSTTSAAPRRSPPGDRRDVRVGGRPGRRRACLEPRRPVRPGPRALDVAQDRLAEKDAFRTPRDRLARFAAVDDREGLDAAVEPSGCPASSRRAAAATTARARSCSAPPGASSTRRGPARRRRR